MVGGGHTWTAERHTQDELSDRERIELSDRKRIELSKRERILQFGG